MEYDEFKKKMFYQKCGDFLRKERSLIDNSELFLWDLLIFSVAAAGICGYEGGAIGVLIPATVALYCVDRLVWCKGRLKWLNNIYHEMPQGRDYFIPFRQNPPVDTLQEG